MFFIIFIIEFLVMMLWVFFFFVYGGGYIMNTVGVVLYDFRFIQYNYNGLRKILWCL